MLSVTVALATADDSAAVRVVVIGLLLSALVALIVFVVLRETVPRYARPAAALVFLVGALLTLLEVV